MDFLANADPLSKVLGAVVVLLSTLIAFFRWIRPKLRVLMRGLGAAWDAIVGREAVTDSITGVELVPALPGIGVRMATTETSLTHLASAVAQLVDQGERLTHLEQRTTSVEDRTTVLEGGVVERVVTRAESAAAWRAVEAVANGTPEPSTTPEVSEQEPDQN